MKTFNSPEGRFAKLVEEFFLDRLIRQRNSSPQTVAAYRDCFRLLFEFVRDRWKKPIESLVPIDLDAPLVLASSRSPRKRIGDNSIRSRNARLAAIRLFLAFRSVEESGGARSDPAWPRHFLMKRCTSGLWSDSSLPRRSAGDH